MNSPGPILAKSEPPDSGSELPRPARRRRRSAPVRRIPVRVLAAGFAVVATVAFAFTVALNDGPGGRVSGPVQAQRYKPSGIDEVAAARRLAALRTEAVFQARPTAAAASAHANALLSAGRSADLRAFLAGPGGRLLEADARAALIVEADYRGGRYAEASKGAAKLAGGPYSAYAALIEARLLYADDAADSGLATERLRTAAGGASSVAAEAWMLRARIALDAEEHDFARSAARRAVEAGAAAGRGEAVSIEADLRAGDAAAVEKALVVRRARFGPGKVDVDGRRLEGLAALRAGDGGRAAAAFDSIALALAQSPRGDLLRAMAKLAAGDVATAIRLAEASVDRAPRDPIARDVAAMAAAARWRADPDGGRPALEATLDDLERVAPALATRRRLAVARVDGDSAAAYTALVAASDDGGVRSAPAFLIGTAGWPADPLALGRDDLRAMSRLAAANGRGDTRARALNDRDGPKLRGDPERSGLETAIEAEIARREGRVAEAIDLFTEALRRGPAMPGVSHGVWAAAQEAGAPERALPALRRAARASPEDLSVHGVLADALETLGDPAAAALALSPLEERLASDAALAERYAGLLVRAGRFARLARFAQMAEAAGQPSTAGRAFLAAGDHERAALAFRAALVLNAGDPAAVSGYVEAMTAIGRGPAANAFLARLSRSRDEGAQPGARRELQADPSAARSPGEEAAKGGGDEDGGEAAAASTRRTDPRQGVVQTMVTPSVYAIRELRPPGETAEVAAPESETPAITDDVRPR